MSKNIIVEIADGLMQIRMQRPEKKNALTWEMYTALRQALIRADEDDQVRVIVLTGSEDCFTAGHDLRDFLADQQEDKGQFILQFLNTLAFVKKPLVAAVNGVAIGVGTTMLLHCDLVFAGEKATFQLPFVNLGLVPEAGSTLLLPQLIGYQKTAELLLLGESFSAEKGQQLGIINQVCHDDRTLQLAIDAAKKIAAQPSLAVEMTKSLMKRAQEEPLRQRIAEETAVFLSRLESPEVHEALLAFSEKRKPDFSKIVSNEHKSRKGG